MDKLIEVWTTYLNKFKQKPLSFNFKIAVQKYLVNGNLDAYTQFCQKHKIKPKTRIRFQREFRENTKADDGVTSIDGKQARVWWHITLKEEET
jgi:hypothetical protein